MPLFTTQNRVATGEKARPSEEENREAWFADFDEKMRQRWGR